jgi:hypothetical protein
VRALGFLVGVTLLLIGGTLECFAMGSGPHPNVPIPYGIGHPQTPAAPEGLMLAGSLAAVGLITWALRRQNSAR